MTFRSRIGTFFILMGLFLLLLFIGAMISKGENRFLFFLTSATCLAFGFYLNHRPRTATPGARFTGVRKLGERFQKDRVEYAKKQKDKKKK